MSRSTNNFMFNLLKELMSSGIIGPNYLVPPVFLIPKVIKIMKSVGIKVF